MAFPADDTLAEHVGEAAGQAVVVLRRQPLAYATSFPIDHVSVEFADETTAELAVKDLRWSSLLGDAPATKPPWLHSPGRCIGVHLNVLAPAGLGARVWAAGTGAPPDGEWLAIELVAGNPLWEIGDVAVWEHVARWLAAFHERWRVDVAAIRRQVPDLIEFSATWMEPWIERATLALAAGDDSRRDAALHVLDRHAAGDVDSLTATAPTLVHGEFYPSNVLVAADGRVCPVDWELTGIGDPMIDLAALVTGWEDATAARLAAAYAGRAGERDDEHLHRTLAHWRLMNAVRWLGWAPGWQPPREHAHDWIGEIVAAGKVLD